MRHQTLATVAFLAGITAWVARILPFHLGPPSLAILALFPLCSIVAVSCGLVALKEQTDGQWKRLAAILLVASAVGIVPWVVCFVLAMSMRPRVLSPSLMAWLRFGPPIAALCAGLIALTKQQRGRPAIILAVLGTAMGLAAFVELLLVFVGPFVAAFLG